MWLSIWTGGRRGWGKERGRGGRAGCGGKERKMRKGGGGEGGLGQVGKTWDATHTLQEGAHTFIQLIMDNTSYHAEHARECNSRSHTHRGVKWVYLPGPASSHMAYIFQRAHLGLDLKVQLL